MGDIGDSGHDVRAAALVPEGQQYIEHLLRQRLKFFPCHRQHHPVSIFDISIYNILSNIDYVKKNVEKLKKPDRHADGPAKCLFT